MPLQVVAAIIENSLGEILLAQRPPGKRMAGFWEFPGGKLESGETPEMALVREIREELNMEIEFKRRLGVFHHERDESGLQLHVFVVAAKSEPNATTEVQVFRWADPISVDAAILTAPDRAPLTLYLRTKQDFDGLTS